MMAAWLKSLGLEEKDVRVKYMSPVQALGAFAGGLGDVVALWAPLTYDADAKGFKPAALSSNCGVSQPSSSSPIMSTLSSIRNGSRHS